MITADRNPIFQAALAQWRRRFPEISEQEALADLWGQGIRTDETFRAFQKRLADAEDDRHHVFKHPKEFAGWHIVSAEIYKPGIYRFCITGEKLRGAGKEMIHGFCAQNILTVAIEQKLCTRPNGFTLPV